MKYSLPKGTKDILPDSIHRWQQAEQSFAEVCARFGYKEIRIPTFEHTEVFARGVGNTTDVVRKEMYTFEDKGGRSITLRPEGTAGVARSFIENGMSSMPSPVRLFYNITAFRYEKMQKGRFREFHQFGAEAFGAKGPEMDAEIISLLSVFFDRIGLKKTRLCINSIGCPECRPNYHEALKVFYSDKTDQMCTDCLQRFDQNPLRLIDCKEDKCKKMVAQAPRQTHYLCDKCKEHFSALQTYLDKFEIEYKVDTGIVRGLDYYTRTVFEFVSDNVGTQGTICGGGRYDKLIEMMGGPAVPGVGFAMGVERLLMEMDAQKIIEQKPDRVSLYIANMSESTQSIVYKIADELRRADISCEADVMNRSFRAQMKYANKVGIPYLMVIGDDEISNQQAQLKRMSDGKSFTVELSELSAHIQDAMNESIKEQGD